MPLSNPKEFLLKTIQEEPTPPSETEEKLEPKKFPTKRPKTRGNFAASTSSSQNKAKKT